MKKLVSLIGKPMKSNNNEFHNQNWNIDSNVFRTAVELLDSLPTVIRGRAHIT